MFHRAMFSAKTVLQKLKCKLATIIHCCGSAKKKYHLCPLLFTLLGYKYAYPAIKSFAMPHVPAAYMIEDALVKRREAKRL